MSFETPDFQINKESSPENASQKLKELAIKKILESKIQDYREFEKARTQEVIKGGVTKAEVNAAFKETALTIIRKAAVQGGVKYGAESRQWIKLGVFTKEEADSIAIEEARIRLEKAFNIGADEYREELRMWKLGAKIDL